MTTFRLLVALALTHLPLSLVACAGEDEAAPVVTTAESSHGPDTSPFERIPDLVERVQPSIVAVFVSGPAGAGEGSGVVWSRDGVVVTNHHVVEGATTVGVQLPPRGARRPRPDGRGDLAGQLRRRPRERRGRGHRNQRCVRATSGGAVALGFAIPAPTVREVVEELLADGRATHAYLGVQLAALTPAVSRQLGVEGGTLVAEVEPGSPASTAGLRRGDVIVSSTVPRSRRSRTSWGRSGDVSQGTRSPSGTSARGSSGRRP